MSAFRKCLCFATCVVHPWAQRNRAVLGDTVQPLPGHWLTVWPIVCLRQPCPTLLWFLASKTALACLPLALTLPASIARAPLSSRVDSNCYGCHAQSCSWALVIR
eukprot:41476-Amphidinium_carterae.1